MMNGGRIAEQGVYVDLIKNGDAFSQLVEEYGSTTKKAEKEDDDEEDDDEVKPEKEKKVATRGAVGAGLMQDEEREVGAVSWAVYSHYARSMGSIVWAPLLIGCFAMAQVANGM